jgi:hypothetical protein
MSQEDKIRYLRIALQLQGINMGMPISDQIIQTYEKICKLGGNFSLKDAAEIEVGIQEKYKQDA